MEFYAKQILSKAKEKENTFEIITTNMFSNAMKDVQHKVLIEKFNQI